jgi:hypothetical protein
MSDATTTISADSSLSGRFMLSSIALASESVDLLKRTSLGFVDGADAVGVASIDALEEWTPSIFRPALAPATKVGRTVQEQVTIGARTLLSAV